MISLLVRSFCPATGAANPGAASPWISCAARRLAWVRGAAAAVRRWRVRRWLKLNRDRIALIACDAHELSELGRRVRTETLRELQDRLRD